MAHGRGSGGTGGAKGRRIFQAKNEQVEATPERLHELENFQRELEDLMAPRV